METLYEGWLEIAIETVFEAIVETLQETWDRLEAIEPTSTKHRFVTRGKLGGNQYTDLGSTSHSYERPLPN